MYFQSLLSWKKTTVGIKTFKMEKTSIFIVHKRLKEAKVKFLSEHDKKKFIECIYIVETPDANISDISNELKQILVHNCFYTVYQEKQKWTLISHPFRGVLGLIPFLKAIK